MQTPTEEEADILTKYSSSKYNPKHTPGGISFPFVDINNVAIISGASYSPGILAGQSVVADRQRAQRSHQPGDPGHRGHGQLHHRGHLRLHQGRTGVGLPEPGVKAAAKALKLS